MVEDSAGIERGPDTLGRRVMRGVLVALLIGLAGLAISMAPALFIQSVFIGSAQRCEDLMVFEEAAFDEVRTSCAEDLSEAPVWFPVGIVVGGAIMGIAGGFVYGFINPARYRREQERPWLPF